MTNALSYALLAYIVAIIAAILGFGGVSEAAAGLARVSFFVALVLFIVFLLLGLFGPRRLCGTQVPRKD